MSFGHATLWMTMIGWSVCSIGQAQPQANGRELGFAVSTAEDGDFALAIAKAQAACMSTILISTGWSGLHPDTATWTPDVLEQFDLMNAYFPTIGLKVELQLRTVNTVVEELPAELSGLPYDDPLVVQALLETLDTLFAHIPGLDLAALNIGNESDALWGTDASRYEQFGNLLAAVKPHAKALYEALHGDTLSVGTTFTWGGLTDGTIAPLCQLANTTADHISATYYAIQNDFTVKPPSAVVADLDLLTNMQPGPKPIRLAEIGYPSGSLCNGTEALQSGFVQWAFTAWDQHMDRIPAMNWFLTTDWDSATVADLGVYYGIDSPTFLEYLRTLGLRTWPGSGTDKLAYGTLLCELQARSFCNTNCTNGIPEQVERSAPQISPVPTTGWVRCTVPVGHKATSVTIRSMDGGKAVVLPYAPEMDLSDLPAGVYAVEVEGLVPVLIVLMH